MPLQVQAQVVGIEKSIEDAFRRAGKNLRLNLGTSARNIDALSQPLGRITGQADQFTKSMEAANARVLAFGASVGVLSAVTKGFKDLVMTTIEVEKSLADINSILKQNSSELNRFKKEIFDVAKDTGQSFQTVAEAALELSRQGLAASEVTNRLNDSLILARLSGLSAADSVSGLTAAINAFSSAGITSSEVLNKISAAAASAAVSDRDLIEGIKRSGSVAVTTGVEFDKLLGIISALQEKTARGGAVIGNSLKTIFIRLQDLDNLKTIQDLGVQVTDLSGEVLSSDKIIQNLAGTFKKLSQTEQANLADKLVGKFQIAPFLALLEDYNSEVVRSAEVAEVAFNATNEAYQRNATLNKTLSALINEATVSVKELANALGEIGVTDSLKNILSYFNIVITKIREIFEGEGIGSDLAKGLIKGISAVISGPGLAIFGAIIIKLTADLVKFGISSLKTFFGLNKAAQEQAQIQGQIASTLLTDKTLREKILLIENQTISVEEKRRQQAVAMTLAYTEQLKKIQQMQTIAAGIAPSVMMGTRGVRTGKSAGGFLPIGAEKADINKGVGGAPSSAKPVVIPNFSFGGGQKGVMVANDSEYIVKNFASGGDAIFNQNMAASMGLPAGAKKITAAGGFIPNFAVVPPEFSKFIASKGLNIYQLAGSKTGSVTQKAWDKNPNLQREFNALSEADKRNLLQASRQTTVLGQSVAKSTPYGVLFPDAVGNATPTTIKAGNFPIKAIPIATDPPNSLYTSVRSSLIEASKQYASKLGFRPDIVNEEKFSKIVDKNLNVGAIEAAYGSVFEAAFQGAIGTEQVSNSLWDLQDRGQINTLLSKMQTSDLLQKLVTGLEGIEKADFKNSLSAGNLNSLANKIKNSQLKTKRSAKGYIPNFAGGALEDAIAREKAAGLPISQIRINQDGSLRSSKNPMGLAVTNTRDEPTGAIPNFVSGAGIQTMYPRSASMSTSQTQIPDKPQKDMLGPIFAAQMALTALTGATSDATKGFGLFTNKLTSSLSTITTATFATQGLKSLATEGSTASKVLGKLGGVVVGVTAMLSVLRLTFDSIKIMNGDFDAASIAVAKFSDKLNSFKLPEILGKSDAEKVKSRVEASSIIKNAEYDFYKSGGAWDLKVLKGQKFGAGLAGRTLDKISGDVLSENEDIQNMVQTIRDIGLITDEELKKQIVNIKKTSGNNAEKFKVEFSKLTNSFMSVSNSVVSDIEELFKSTPTEQDIKSFKERYANNPEGLRQIESLLPIFQKRQEDAEKKGRQEKTDAQQKRVDQVSAEFAEKQIQSAIELRKINLTRTTQAEKNLKIAQALNNVSKLEILNLETLAKKDGLRREIANKALDFIKSQVDLSKELNITEEERAGVLEKINALDMQSLQSENDVRNALDSIFNITALNKEQKELLIQKAIKQFLLLKDEEKIRNEIIDQEKRSEESLLGKTDTQEKFNALLDNSLRKMEAAAKSNFDDKSFDLELKKLDISQERIQLEQNYYSTAYEKAKQLYALEQKSLDLDLAKAQAQQSYDVTSAQSDLQKKLIEIARKAQSGTITSINFKQATDFIMSGDYEEFLDLLKDTTYYQEAQIEINETSNKVKKLGQDFALAAEQIAISKETMEKGEAVYKKEKGFFGGLERGFVSLENEADSFAFDMGEKIPQMFRDGMVDAMEATILKGEDLGDTLRSIATSFLSQMSRSLLTSSVNQFIGLFKGSQNPSVTTAASGGMITGGSGVKDDVPAMLMGGEYVINKKSVNKYGRGFLEMLNSGTVPKFAKGGYFAPGLYGQKAIVGKKNLLGFATQAYTTGANDVFMSSGDAAAISLEPESVRLTTLGRKMGTPLQQATIDAKQQAFDLYGQQMAQEKQAALEAYNQDKAFKDALKTAAISMAVSYLGSVGVSGFKAGMADTGTLTGGLKGAAGAYGDMFRGLGQIGQGNFADGLSLLEFASNGGVAPKATIVNQGSSSSFLSNVSKAAATAMATGKTVSLPSITNAFGVDPDLADNLNRMYNLPSLGVDADNIERLKKLDDILNGGNKWEEYPKGFDGMVLPPKATGKATGGSIPSAGGIDTIPAMLSGGEFIMNNAATQRLGAGNLQALNSGASSLVTEEKSEELNQKIIEKLDELIKASSGMGEINITVNSKGEESTQSTGSQEADQNLARKIKEAVVRVIEEEKRLGGTLRRGLV